MAARKKVARKSAGAILDRAAILAAEDHTTERVAVPEWGGDVLVRTMSGRDRDLWEQFLYADNRETARRNIRSSLCAACVVDEAGETLFSEEDLDALAAKSAAALDRVYEVAARLNRVTPADVDELEKN